MTPSARCQAAIELLDEIEASKAPADMIFNRYFRARRYAGGGDRRAVRALVYTVLRKRGQIDWWCEHLKLARVSRTRTLVCLASNKSPWPDVAAASAFQEDRFGPAPLSRDEDAVLRQIAERGFDQDAQAACVRGNVPDWLEREFCPEININFDFEINAMDGEAETDLRVNTLRATREDVMDALAAVDIACAPTPYAPHGIRLAHRRPLDNLRAFRDGHFEPQGEASQLAVDLIGAEPGWRVLDLCAGAGGKSLAIAAQMQNHGYIRLCDVDPGKLQRAEKRMSRAGVTIAGCLSVDGTDTAQMLKAGENYDLVIIDAPCSGSGVWRRNPEAKWRLTAETLERHTCRQRELLRSAARVVRPGGTIAYMTCSVLEAENRAMVDAFLSESGKNFRRRPLAEDWRRVTGRQIDSPVADFQFTPGTHGMDGFYIAVLEGTAS